MERCVGCRSAPGPVCPDCKGLTVGEVVATRWRWPPFVGLALAAAFCVLAVATWRVYAGRFHPGFGVVFVPLLVTWAVRRLKRPHRLRLVRDRLELTSMLGGTRKLPLAEVESDKGSVVHVPTHTRIKVGATRYEGAVRFHRALRARRDPDFRLSRRGT